MQQHIVCKENDATSKGNMSQNPKKDEDVGKHNNDEKKEEDPRKETKDGMEDMMNVETDAGKQDEFVDNLIDNLEILKT
ncbi:hypothetical protein FRX31_034346 [Thalictrum thalictroides]|uniref:Uncharacterized protein n=1 Tax=Thalictrum thalictroides TaxID=46969 RepID=A0A7J6UV47_THATH|nr:hypothetical protein FRX31_034346 [Thalictrum thalictroides]